jgi:hypothetical protein
MLEIPGIFVSLSTMKSSSAGMSRTTSWKGFFNLQEFQSQLK